MICETCHGSGLVWRHFATPPDAMIRIENYRECRACGGSGVMSCCDVIVGGADDVTNQGEQGGPG